MALSTSSISSGQIFPPDYRIFNIGENLEIMYGDKVEYYKIVNRTHVPWIERSSTSWLLDAGDSYTIGDLNSWLEPGEDELMILAMSILSDRNMELRVTLPGSDRRFGTKKDTDVAITPNISPWEEPRVTLMSMGTTYVPSFTLKNPTEYKNKVMKIGMTGFRYKLKKLKEKPAVYSTLNLDIIRG